MCGWWVTVLSITADELVPLLRTAPVIKRVADYWPHGDMVLRDWLLKYAAKLIFSSPSHLTGFPHAIFPYANRVEIIPPYIDLERFSEAREASEASGRREGTLWLGQMKNPMQKGISQTLQWAAKRDLVVDFYGENAVQVIGDHPNGRIVQRYPVSYKDVPEIMARYERFVFLPQRNEPFGRTVIEALAAGCKVVTNAVPGCIWYLETGAVEQIDQATDRFWEVVQGVLDEQRVTADTQ